MCALFSIHRCICKYRVAAILLLQLVDAVLDTPIDRPDGIVGAVREPPVQSAARESSNPRRRPGRWSWVVRGIALFPYTCRAAPACAPCFGSVVFCSLSGLWNRTARTGFSVGDQFPGGRFWWFRTETRRDSFGGLSFRSRRAWRQILAFKTPWASDTSFLFSFGFFWKHKKT